MTDNKNDDIHNEEDSTLDQTVVEIGSSEHCLKKEINRKESSMLGVVLSASTHHVSTEKFSSDVISNAPHPVSKLSLMGIEKCCVGNVTNIMSNRDRDG